MAENETPEGPQAGGSDAEAQQEAPFTILLQYLKDLSFENPNAPQVFAGDKQQPQLDVNVDVTVQQIHERDFEVSLHLNANAKNGEDTVYQTELVYSGIVRIGELPQEILQALLFVEIPRFLFPYARNIISTSIQEGGFPAVMLAPIDFMAMFRQRVAAAQAQQENQEEAAPAEA